MASSEATSVGCLLALVVDVFQVESVDVAGDLLREVALVSSMFGGNLMQKKEGRLT